MQNTLKITSDIKLVGTIRLLAEAYEQISVMKMQKVRGSVLATRSFLDHLNQVFIDVKASYKEEIEKRLKKVKDPSKMTFSTLNHNGKTVSILITSNAKLYGDIDLRIWNLFKTDIFQKNSDIVVTGKIGHQMMEDLISSGNHTNLKYQYFEVSESIQSLEEIKQIIDLIINYQTVNVYYARFQNVMIQVPTASIVSGEESLDIKDNIDKRLNYAFEPSLDYILNLFETQVFSALFKQTFHESELSRHASRITAMEESLVNIEKLEKVLKFQEKVAKKMLSNKKRMESLSGMSLWK